MSLYLIWHFLKQTRTLMAKGMDCITAAKFRETKVLRYCSERILGKAIKALNLPRDEIVIMTKVIVLYYKSKFV